tara:strand:- start:731 stop:1219 length:489 start_codon:yes stop_codon:yes gene_type:complete
MNAHGYTNEQVIHVPAVFGVIIDNQEPGTPIIDRNTIIGRVDDHGEPFGEELVEDAVLDFHGSGSIWFLSDNERRYFVKWFNKQPYQYDKPRPTTFTPLTNNGKPVFNKALFAEKDLHKAPDFIGKLQRKVAKRKEVESVLNERLNLDECSNKCIAGIVCEY